MAHLVTLTTDFGLADGYAGSMKGVIYHLAPQVCIVDITHLVPAQNIASGAFVLFGAARLYPQGTVHVAVVDPGVGSQRRGLVVETEGFFYVGPDNGLFTPVFETESVRGIYEISNRDWMRFVVSATFHGRDVFAPVAAHLANGLPAHDVGPPVSDPVALDFWSVSEASGEVVGRVVHVDHFGNAISILSRAQIDALKRPYEICIGKWRFDRVCQTYSDVGPGEALALYGSLDTLEISINGGHAASRLGIGVGDDIRVIGSNFGV